MRGRRAPGQRYVDTPHVSTVPGLTCWETWYAPDLYQPDHAHTRASIYLVLHGSVLELGDHRTLTVTPGAIFYLPAGQSHASRFLAPQAHVFSLWMEHGWQRRMEECSLSLDAPAYFSGGPLSGLALRLCHESRQTDAASSLILEGLTLELLGGIARHRAAAPARRPPRWLQQARELLREQYSDSPTLETIALTVGVHPVHLASAFRRQYGCTVGDYVRRLRIDYACREIARSNTPLIEIALDAGFANQSHFTRVFKRLTSMTPAEYRRAFSRT